MPALNIKTNNETIPRTGRFLQTLSRRPILLDAALGTRLIARGLDLAGDDPAIWNLTRPNDVLDVHLRDVASGSDAVLTNTFGANRFWLARFGREKEVESINRSATAIAREAVGPDRFILGDIGPTAVENAAAYREQAEILIESGVNALILETHSAAQADLGLRHLRELGASVPILVSLHVWPEPCRELLERFERRGAAAIGANCLLGAENNTMELCRKLQQSTTLPLLIKPAAGLPGGPLESPESFACAVPEWLRLGVRLFGGCCGTTEAHIEALRRALERNR